MPRATAFENICHLVYERIVAAGDNKRMFNRANIFQQPNLHRFATFVAFAVLWNVDDAVRIRKAGDDARPSAQGDSDKPPACITQARPDKLAVF